MSYDGAKIITLRKTKGWSQAELARQARISQPSLHALEHQVTKRPKFDTLQQVATALGVPLREIMRPSKKPTADQLADLTELFERLNPNNKAAVLAAVKALLDSQK
jgi:transcriptional regulator with XRE-family HTH domain